MKKGLIGKKLGMTQIFNEKGDVIPVTVIEAGPCAVVAVRTVERDGYSALQLGFEEIPERKASKPVLGAFKKAGVTPRRHLKEFRLDNIDGIDVGQSITTETFAVGEKVDVTGLTKGRGFTGAVKRWNQKTLRMTHGTGPIHRQVGSMGANSSPSRVFKNKHMGGQYGHEKVTVQNLLVAKIDPKLNILAVRGAIPGPRGGIVFVRDTVKNGATVK